MSLRLQLSLSSQLSSWITNIYHQYSTTSQQTLLSVIYKYLYKRGSSSSSLQATLVVHNHHSKRLSIEADYKEWKSSPNQI
jgi:hypothetical protein